MLSPASGRKYKPAAPGSGCCSCLGDLHNQNSPSASCPQESRHVVDVVPGAGGQRELSLREKAFVPSEKAFLPSETYPASLCTNGLFLTGNLTTCGKRLRPVTQARLLGFPARTSLRRMRGEPGRREALSLRLGSFFFNQRLVIGTSISFNSFSSLPQG